jgi:hypothetical protein
MSGTEFVKLIQDWQTLFAALLALLAAWWTVQTIKQQITTESDRHKDAQKRKELSARAQIPDALSALCRFTESCMKYHDGRSQEVPVRATDAITTLKSAIEFVAPQPAEKLFELVSFYQVHNARLFSSLRHRGAPTNADRMFDTVVLRFYTDRMYAYARNEAETVSDELTRDRLLSSLKSVVTLFEYVGNEDRYAPVRRLIERV